VGDYNRASDIEWEEVLRNSRPYIGERCPRLHDKMLTEDFYGEILFVTLVSGLDQDDITQLNEYLRVSIRIGYRAVYLYQFKRFVGELTSEDDCTLYRLVRAEEIRDEIRDFIITTR
jgi:hypothetical protein